MSLIENISKIINTKSKKNNTQDEIAKLKEQLKLKQLHINRVNSHYKKILNKHNIQI